MTGIIAMTVAFAAVAPEASRAFRADHLTKKQAGTRQRAGFLREACPSACLERPPCVTHATVHGLME
ncbi:hypothetical protein GCM10011503_10350 [Henriciella pelagia]|uniref:Uncharacterized protein n=1 Tax=Henriciella pelagia TaxID=1977912 RepID=A0ABQ1J9S1_9PROT|nr:hypothetical protein GCM10011503_10350 [Henriciella pelagia]